jgi:hypothetical protein
MKTDFTPETVRSVLNRDPHMGGTDRTALNISIAEMYSPEFEDLAGQYPTTLQDPLELQTIGSRSKIGSSHQPVIETPGGAKIQGANNKRVRIDSPVQRTSYQIGLSHFEAKSEVHSYGPDSFLRDVLGDNGIDLEVFDAPVSEHTYMDNQTHVIGQHVTAIVLRSREAGAFDVADAGPDTESHLYIQQRFSKTEHDVLIHELGELGLIKPEWQALVEKIGMSVVPTPWFTENAIAQAA